MTYRTREIIYDIAGWLILIVMCIVGTSWVYCVPFNWCK